MLEEIGSVENIPSCVKRAKDKSDPFRLMGFGHRLYKNVDPRAALMRNMCHTLLSHLKITDPLLMIAMELEKVALSDEYFISRKLYPNVDFYSGICFRALGIPRNMFTVIFAVGRSLGWISQWCEMASEPVVRISRPRQMYDGELERAFVPIGERTNGGGGGESEGEGGGGDGEGEDREPAVVKRSSFCSEEDDEIVNVLSGEVRMLDVHVANTQQA